MAALRKSEELDIVVRTLFYLSQVIPRGGAPATYGELGRLVHEAALKAGDDANRERNKESEAGQWP